MVFCEQQHNVCLSCANDVFKTTKKCPFCKTPITLKLVKKNRMISKVIEDAAKSKGKILRINPNPKLNFN